MIELPTISYSALAPILVVMAGAMVSLLLEAFLPRRLRYPVQLPLAILVLFGSLVSVVLLLPGVEEEPIITGGGAVAVDGPSLFLQGTLAVLGILGLLLLGERTSDSSRGGSFSPVPAAPAGGPRDRAAASSSRFLTEVFPLVLFALAGMMLFVAANNLILMFIALEILSLPLYVLAGVARRRRLASQEAAIKYFLLGAFASAFFVYGLAMLYGYAGSVDLGAVREAAVGSAAGDGLLFTGVALLTVGLLFKVGAVPFHSWVPDVYQGAPTAVTAIMAATTKVAALGALLRVYSVAFGGLTWDWQPVLAVLAGLTMVVGSLLAVTQTDLKRMLAYSSIAQAGFILVAVTAGSQDGISATLFYVAAYGLAVLGAFALVPLVRDGDTEATHLARWAGLGQRSPALAAVFALFLLAFTGIPLTSGFVAKLSAFGAALDAGLTWLVILAVVASAVAAFFYLRVIVLMFFTSAGANPPSVVVPGVLTGATIGVAAVATLVLGLWPQPLLDVVDGVGVFVG